MSSGESTSVAQAAELARAGRRVRERAGVSVEQMAAALGVPVGVLLQWEGGLLEPAGIEGADWARFVHLLDLHDRRDEVSADGV